MLAHMCMSLVPAHTPHNALICTHTAVEPAEAPEGLSREPAGLEVGPEGAKGVGLGHVDMTKGHAYVEVAVETGQQLVFEGAI